MALVEGRTIDVAKRILPVDEVDVDKLAADRVTRCLSMTFYGIPIPRGTYEWHVSIDGVELDSEPFVVGRRGQAPANENPGGERRPD